MQSKIQNKRAELKKIISRINNLPSPPIVLQQMNKIISNPYSSAIDIASIVSEDPSMTARVLRVTNSAYYGLPREITSVKQAVVYIGLETLKNIILSTSIMGAFGKRKDDDGEYVNHFWRHSLAVAFLSRIISRISRPSDIAFQEDSFSAGLLHDIGKIILYSHLPDVYQQKIKLMEDDSLCEYTAETIIIGCSHCELGLFLTEMWNLPKPIQDSVTFHHNPSDVPQEGLLPSIVHLADQLTHSAEFLNVYGASLETTALYGDVWAKVNIQPEMRRNLIDSLASEYEKSETFLNLANVC